MPPPAGNPFATRHVRPGALEFIFPPGQDAACLVERLRLLGWWGQILGPHGSGKSTLLAALVPVLARAGRQVRMIVLHDGQRRLPLDVRELAALGPDLQLIIDGYEQLAWYSRWRLRRFCRRYGCGLLVTAHADVGLPTLYTISPSLELVRELVAKLLPPGDDRVGPDDVARLFQVRRGDVRETLFDLYDLVEARMTSSLRGT